MGTQIASFHQLKAPTFMTRISKFSLAALMINAMVFSCKTRHEPGDLKETQTTDEVTCLFQQNQVSTNGIRAAGAMNRDLWRIIDSLAKASLATYDDDSSIRSAAAKWGYPSVDIVSSGAMRAFVASNSRCVVLAFRGTDMLSLRDWFVDARATSTSVRHGRIHTGFYKAFKSLQRDIDKTLARHGASRKFLWVTGHSLGGALAGVYAYTTKYEGFIFQGPYIHKIVTFGQPLFADDQLSDTMRKEFYSRFYRVVNGVDIVSTVPFWLKHFGSLVWLKENGVDFRQETILAGGPTGGQISEAQIPSELTPSEESLKKFLEMTKSERPIAPVKTDGSEPIPVGLAWPRPLQDHLMTNYFAKINEVIRRLQ